MLEADYIFLHELLGSGEPGRLRRALAEILRCQGADGSWSLYPGGPGNVSLAVKCYFACKLMGLRADDPRLARCRDWILAHGGVVACNTFTKIYLCSLGQYDYEAAPAIPPGDRAFPLLVLFQYLRAFVLVARDPGAAGDHLREAALPGAAARAGHRRVVRGRARPSRFAPAAEPPGPLLVAQFLPGGRPAPALARGRPDPPAAPAGAAAGRAVDAGAPGALRRPGRDLSGHAQFDHRPALPRLPGGPSAGRPRPPRVRAPGHRAAGEPRGARGHLPHAALRLAGLGHGAGGLRPGRSRRAARRPAPGRRRRMDAGQGGPPAGRLVGEAAGRWSRAAGISSSTTSSIPTRTTPRRCCWPSARWIRRAPSASGRRPRARCAGSSRCSAARAAGAASTRTARR